MNNRRDIRVTKLANGSVSIELSGEYEKPEIFPQQFAIGDRVNVMGYRAQQVEIIDADLEFVTIPGSYLNRGYWRRVYECRELSGKKRPLHYRLTEGDLLEMNPREPSEAVLMIATYPLTHMGLISADTTKPVLGKGW